jgi:hypothetical protein
MSTSGLDAEKIQFNQEERTANVHQRDSLNLLIFTTLLVVVVLTIWIFKRLNFRYLHETCLALIYGRRTSPELTVHSLRHGIDSMFARSRIHHRRLSPVQKHVQSEARDIENQRNITVEGSRAQLDLVRVGRCPSMNRPHVDDASV